MPVLLIGASYRDISLDDLELLEAKSEEFWEAIFTENSKEFGITGCVVVSTCNRFEIYVDSFNTLDSEQHILAKITDVTGLPSNRMQHLSGSEVTHHLFRVAAGLESMIVGEVEVAGQVKRSLSRSQLLSKTTRDLEMLFQESARVSKKVATETGLGMAGRSLVTGGLDLLKQSGFAIKGKKVLVIGTGAYARVVTAALKREEVAEIFVHSITDRAKVFSLTHTTTPVSKGGLSEALSQVDFVVTCNGTHGALITADDIQALNKEIFPIIDLSLARDVERSVEKLNNVLMIDLNDIYQNAPREHSETIDAAQSIINRAVVEFEEKLRSRNSYPFAKLVRTQFGARTTAGIDPAFAVEAATISNG